MIKENIRKEILRDHESNNYMQANLMPLRDKLNVPKERQQEYKRAAEELTADSNFPYEVEYWLQENTVKMAYKPL